MRSVSSTRPNVLPFAPVATAKRRKLSPLEEKARLAFLAGKRAKGWDVARVASESGCSHDSVERYISGERPVTGKVLVAVGVVDSGALAASRVGSRSVGSCTCSNATAMALPAYPAGADDGGKTPRSGATGIQHSPNDGGHASEETERETFGGESRNLEGAREYEPSRDGVERHASNWRAA